jgi:N-methylhydantoinase A/oxoprolinase/acetone carboxylase beta subunit
VYRLGIDIGGTFADGALIDASTGRLWRAKSLATPQVQSRAVGAGVEELLAQAGAGAEEVEWVVHGTTIVANTLIERKGATTALLTTEGFRDLLELGADTRYDIYDLAIEFPQPLVPRSRRLELP